MSWFSYHYLGESIITTFGDLFNRQTRFYYPRLSLVLWEASTLIQTAQEVIKLLWDIRTEEENKTWAKVVSRFQTQAAEIWHEWYREASGDKDGKHPLGVKIEDGKFLERILQ